jgi:hypothetical protein
LGTTIVSTLMIVISILRDRVTSIPIGYFRVSTIVNFNTFGEVVLIIVQWCSNLWLPISILYGAQCGCAYTSDSLLLIWIDGWICWFYSPN